MTVTGRPYDVFISYAHRDGQEVADFLDRELKRAGLTTFRDTTDVRIGDQILDRLSFALEQSSYFLLIMTPAYFESGWCRQETFAYLTSKLDSGRGAVLPVIAVACEPPAFIRPYKWADLRTISLEGYLGLMLDRIRDDLPLETHPGVSSKFPAWVDEACEVGSLARRSATHILRGENREWHLKNLDSLYYRVVKIRTDRSARVSASWDSLLEELQNAVYSFRGSEEDRMRIERARTAIRDRAQREIS